MNNLVVGGAGFIGYHLIKEILKSSEYVICLDNFSTGKRQNVSEFIENNKFEIVEHNIQETYSSVKKIDRIWHLACPASPPHYQKDPIDTLKTCFLGTYNLLNIAKENNSRILLASTSEIYGEPQKHPQLESYNGNVNPIGLRSCYDEGKRVSETLCFDFMRQHNVDIAVARIFNTYGPKMSINDGRVVSNFIVQAISNETITLFGKGEQTRSFCYVSDLVDGLIRLMNSSCNGPINIGNDNEISIYELSNLIKKKINPNLKNKFLDLPEDDPSRRNPDLKKAKKFLGWEPKVTLDFGLNKTIEYFQKELKIE